MYNNPYMPAYMNNYNQQNISDRIDNQIAQLQQMKEQMKNTQTGGITQNFQLTPAQNNIKYANTIDDVLKETVLIETPFFSKDMSVMWLKNPNGSIKSFELNEIIPKDNKDILISSLQMQIEELRKEVKENAKSVDSNDDESVKNETTSNVSVIRTSKKKQ